jgi:hypothetical protein
MPTNRRRRAPRRRGDMVELSPSQEYHLLHGNGFLPFDFVDDEQMQDAWDTHREALMAKWFEEYPADTRPFAWWLFEGVPDYGERPVILKNWNPAYRKNWSYHGILHTNTIPPIQEPEGEFLRRVGEI